MPIDPATAGPAEVRIEVTDDLVRHFASLTGDVSSLHLDEAFARRSAYRRTVVHGMMPLAFLPLLGPLRPKGARCRLRGIEGRFVEPVYAGDTLLLSIETLEPGVAAGEVELDYRVVRAESGAVATEGTIRLEYIAGGDSPSSPTSPAGAPVAGGTGTGAPDTEAPGTEGPTTAAPGAPPGLLVEPPPLNSYRFEQIEKGYEEPPLDFRVRPADIQSHERLVAVVRDQLPDGGSPSLATLDLPNLLALLLFSTSVGVSLPGATATFLEFSATFAADLRLDTAYRLVSRVAHRSKATRIVKKALSVVPSHGGDVLVEGRAATLVNDPGRTMPSAASLREEALDLGLRDKVVIVTGASRGLGETIAKLLAVAGARVVVNYHRGQEDAEAIVAELEAEGAEALAVRADVTREEDVRDLVARTVDRFGGVDVLVNNAARDFRPIPLSKLTWEEINKDLEVIAKGAFLCCREVIPIMLERGGGRIVNISTLATEVPAPGQIKYVMAKSALVGLTRALALEYASRNIQVNMVVPHFVETDFVAHVQEGFRSKIADEIPMKRLSTPTDVAQAVLFLASGFSRFTTGQKVMVTGGATPLL